jgi:hypothetical protein
LSRYRIKLHQLTLRVELFYFVCRMKLVLRLEVGRWSRILRVWEIVKNRDLTPDDKDLMSGNGITRLTLERIKSFIIPLPDIKEQLRIIQPLNIHDARIRTEEQYRDKLKLQKKGLMHDLLTGKVRVKV